MSTCEIRGSQGERSGRPPAGTTTVLGSSVATIGLNEGTERLVKMVMAREPRCRRIVVSGFHGIWEAFRDPQLRAILNSADLWVPDGIAPVAVARLRGCRHTERVPGAELMQAFFERADERGYRSFFYGDSDETLQALRRRLERDYPGHTVAGVYSPPFRELTPEEDERHVRMINEARPDVLWVGLGMPKQDRWIYEHADRLQVPVAVGVGAAFRFLSGHVKRAPQWMGNCGLEWAYRLWREPRKCWRRSLVQGPQFVAHVALELAGLRSYD